MSTLLNSDGSNGVSLQELGDNGVILGAQNQAVIVSTVVDALNNPILGINLGLGSAVEPLLNAALDQVEILGQETPVSALVGILGDILGGSSLNLQGLQVTSIVDALVADLTPVLLANTLTLLQTTEIVTQLTEYAYDQSILSAGEAVDGANGGADVIGLIGDTTVTEVSHTVVSDAWIPCWVSD